MAWAAGGPTWQSRRCTAAFAAGAAPGIAAIALPQPAGFYVIFLGLALAWLVAERWLAPRTGACGSSGTPEAALYRMLAEEATDMVSHVGPDFRRRYISPSCLGLTGFTPEELLQRDVLQSVHPDDLDRTREVARQIMEERRMVRNAYRFLRRDGSYVWVETTNRLLPENQGWLTMTRDISERRALETALEESNRKLALAALQDALTCLPNRRCLMETHAFRHHECAAAGAEIALILLDIDWFKSFNDTYGHPAGDACLSRIADVLRESIPADGLAARLGGEEFAVLLPATNAADATAIAERIASTTADRRIPHSGSPYGQVTLCAGIAALPASAANQDMSDLLAAADEALYEAKRSGRNTVIGLPRIDQAA